MYHETIAQLCKMSRLVLPFLGHYEWVHKNDKRMHAPAAPAAPLEKDKPKKLSSILAQQPSIQFTLPAA